MDDAAFLTKGITARNSISYPDIIIPSNGTTFIMGESGTGKTTLLKLFNQTETQTSGSIYFFGSDVSGMDAVALRSAAILCGQKVFLFNDTIRNNFNEFRQAAEKGQMSDDDMKKYLSICHADRDLDKQCKNLSGGERARVFISICLSFRPKVLMLDEPTSSLDNDTAISVMKNIRSYCAENGMTLIAVSHDRSIIDAADNIITLGGKV